MSLHRYRIGQLVEFMPDKLQVSVPTGAYSITRLLPAVGRDHQYRIKNAAELFERIARESQLKIRTSP